MQINSFINIQSSPRADFVFGLIAINCLAIGCIFGFLNPGDIDTDGGIFAAVAMKDLSGATLYNDAWENKPPGIFFLIEIFFLIIPSKIYALYTFSIINILLLINGLVALMYRLNKSFILNLLLSGLIIVFTINSKYLGDGLYTEITGCASIIWGLYFLQMYEDGKKNKYLYTSLLLTGTAFWFKEPFILLSIPILVFYLVRTASVRQKFKVLLVFLIPSFCFILLLLVKGSLVYYYHTILYNFSLSSIDQSSIAGEQLQTLWKQIIMPLLVPFVIMIVWMISIVQKKEYRPALILITSLLLAALWFSIISPHKFNHYYLPFIIILFYGFIIVINLYKKVFKTSFLLVYLILTYTVYKLDDGNTNHFSTSFKPYVPDRISTTLLAHPEKNLFIDLVDASEYYVKGNKLFPTFMPVPVASHFGDHASGIANRKRVFNQLSTHKPYFLITTESSSYMYWHFPDPLLYYGNYEKTDSIQARYGKKVILWRLKQHR
ncbi:MAG: glycosyltransferase family 39 protein [Bacteroidota bacterium]